MQSLLPIPPRRNGRPPSLKINMSLVRNLRDRGASVRQVRDEMKLSHATAQRAVRMVDDEKEREKAATRRKADPVAGAKRNRPRFSKAMETAIAKAEGRQ